MRTSAMREDRIGLDGAWLIDRGGSRDPLGFDAGDANLYRYVGNGPTNSTDPSGLESEGEKYTKAFKKAAKASRMSDADIELLFKIAKETPKEDASRIGRHQVCFEWVTLFEQRLNQALVKAKPKAGGPSLPGVKSRSIKILAVPYGAEGNAANDIPFKDKILPSILDFIAIGGPGRSGSSNGLGRGNYARRDSAAMRNRMLTQDHTVWKIVLQNNSIWYLDMGVIQRISARSADINNLDIGPWFITPADKLPRGWYETGKVGVSRHVKND